MIRTWSTPCAGATAAVALGLTTAVLCWALGNLVTDPWNPYVLVLPFALALIASWFASAGDDRAALIAGVAGTFAAQSHVGAVVPVLAIWLTATALRLAWPLEDGGCRADRTARIVLAVAVVSLWIPPIWEQLAGTDGNLSQIARFTFSAAHDPTQGWAKGLGLTTRYLPFWGPWLEPVGWGLLGESLPAPLWQLPIVLLPIALTGGLARRFRDSLALRLVVIQLAAVVACVTAHAMLRGPALNYLTLWSRSIAMTMVAGPLVVLGRRLVPTGDWAASRRTMVAAAAIALPVTAVSTRAWLAAPTTPEDVSREERFYSRAIASALEVVPTGGEVRIVGAAPGELPSPATLAGGLDRAGRVPKLDSSFAGRAGAHRIAPDAESLPTLVVARATAIERVRRTSGARELCVADPLSRDERAEAERLRVVLAGALHAADRDALRANLEDGALELGSMALPGVDPEAMQRYLRLAGGGDKAPYALFFLPSARADRFAHFFPLLELAVFAAEPPRNESAAIARHACALDLVGSAPPSDVTRVDRRSSVQLTGWAADERTRTVPERIVVELAGAQRYYAAATRDLSRPDVATALHVPAFVNAGFQLDGSLTAVDPGTYAVNLLQGDSPDTWTRCDTRWRLDVQ